MNDLLFTRFRSAQLNNIDVDRFEDCGHTVAFQVRLPRICAEQLFCRAGARKNVQLHFEVAGQDLSLPPPKPATTARKKRPKSAYHRLQSFSIYPDILKNISTAELNIAFRLRELLICRGHGLKVH